MATPKKHDRGHNLRLALSKKHEAKKASERSSRWPALERKMIKQSPACEACGSAEHLQVHHRQPFHLHPELELDPANLIVLCMGPWECHLKLGHGGSFKTYNPNIGQDAVAFKVASDADRQQIIGRARRQRLC